MDDKGWTLIELVIVIVILAILTGVVLVSGTAKGPVRLEAACQRLAMDLRFIQMNAMAQQVRFGISFDNTDESYFGYRVNTSNIARDPHSQGNLEVDFDDMQEFKEIQIVSTNFSDAIEFDSIGVPYDENGAVISSEGTVTLSDGINSKTVRIEPETGKVRIE